nr:DoxX family protein [uncultured Bacillus sp.]
MELLSLILKIILGLGFLLFGVLKFGSQQMEDNFKHYGYPAWFRVLTGIIEVISAVSVIVGIWHEAFAAWGSLLLVITMIGAIFTHIKIKDSIKQLVLPSVWLIFALALFVINFDALL